MKLIFKGTVAWDGFSVLIHPIYCPFKVRRRICLGAQPCKGAATEERRCEESQRDCDNRIERAGGGARSSCQGRCGQPAPLGQCQCSAECETFDDCCGDYVAVCSGNTTPAVAETTITPTTVASPSLVAATTTKTTVRPVAAGRVKSGIAIFIKMLLRFKRFELSQN